MTSYLCIYLCFNRNEANVDVTNRSNPYPRNHRTMRKSSHRKTPDNQSDRLTPVHIEDSEADS